METNLKAARKAAGLSQKFVALSLKVSAPTVSEWENGKIYPSATNLIRLSYLYGVSIDYVLENRSSFCSYIKMRKKDMSNEKFAHMCGVSIDLVNDILDKCSENPKSTDHSLKIDDEEMRSIASALNVDKEYLYCLYNSVFPQDVENVKIPADDCVRFGYRLSDDALQLAKDYDSMNPWGQESIRNLANTELSRMEYDGKNTAKEQNASVHH